MSTLRDITAHLIRQRRSRELTARESAERGLERFHREIVEPAVAVPEAREREKANAPRSPVEFGRRFMARVAPLPPATTERDATKRFMDQTTQEPQAGPSPAPARIEDEKRSPFWEVNILHREKGTDDLRPKTK